MRSPSPFVPAAILLDLVSPPFTRSLKLPSTKTVSVVRHRAFEPVRFAFFWFPQWRRSRFFFLDVF